MKKNNRIRYVVNFTPGPNWKRGKSMNEQKLGPHRKYYQNLMELGKVIIAGGFLQEEVGFSILNVDTTAEAKLICKNDPAIEGGILKYTIKPVFTIFLGLNSEQLDVRNLQLDQGPSQ